MKCNRSFRSMPDHEHDRQPNHRERRDARHGRGRSGPDCPSNRTQSEARLAWWHEAKFGMFIHWGLYAIPAGEWKGKPIHGIGEWIMYNAPHSRRGIRAAAAQFNPVKFDAEAWAQLAQDAGMKYMVITSKHHDGFAMFGSKVRRLQHRGRDAVQARPDEGTGRRLRQARHQASGSTTRRRRTGTRRAARSGRAGTRTAPSGRSAWDPRQEGDFDTYFTRQGDPAGRGSC